MNSWSLVQRPSTITILYMIIDQNRAEQWIFLFVTSSEFFRLSMNQEETRVLDKLKIKIPQSSPQAHYC